MCYYMENVAYKSVYIRFQTWMHGVDRKSMKMHMYYLAVQSRGCQGSRLQTWQTQTPKGSNLNWCFQRALENNLTCPQTSLFFWFGFKVENASVRSESSKKARKVLLHTKWVRINGRIFYEVCTLFNPTSPRLLLAWLTLAFSTSYICLICVWRFIDVFFSNPDVTAGYLWRILRRNGRWPLLTSSRSRRWSTTASMKQSTMFRRLKLPIAQ